MTGFGLCQSCRFQKIIANDRGSRFSMCLWSQQDPAYPRYPAMPVRACQAHSPLLETPQTK